MRIWKQFTSILYLQCYVGRFCRYKEGHKGKGKWTAMLLDFIYWHGESAAKSALHCKIQGFAFIPWNYSRDNLFPICFENVNYSRYLTVVSEDMIALENDFPEAYDAVCNGNFNARLSRYPLSRMKADEILEVRINKDTKSHADTAGFSSHSDAVMRQTLTWFYRAHLWKTILFLDYTSLKFTHNDLTPSRWWKSLCSSCFKNRQQCFSQSTFRQFLKNNVQIISDYRKSFDTGYVLTEINLSISKSDFLMQWELLC